MALPEPTLPQLQTANQVPTSGALVPVTNPVIAPQRVIDMMVNFPEEDFNLSQSATLVKLIQILAGESGAGQLRKVLFATRLAQTLEGSHFYAIDAFWGALFGMRRLSFENISQIDPATFTATKDEWREARAADASYRSRIKQLAQAIQYGTSPLGMRLAAEALLAAPVDIYESYVESDISLKGYTWSEVEATYATWSAIDGVGWAHLQGQDWNAPSFANLLNENQASAEYDSSGVSGDSNTSLIRDNTYAADGSWSWRLTSIATGGVIFITDPQPCNANVRYTGIASFRGDQVHTCFVQLEWLDANHNTISIDTTDTGQLDSTSAFVEHYFYFPASPANTAYVRLRATQGGMAANERMWVDKLGIFPGQVTTWSSPISPVNRRQFTVAPTRTPTLEEQYDLISVLRQLKPAASLIEVAPGVATHDGVALAGIYADSEYWSLTRLVQSTVDGAVNPWPIPSFTPVEQPTPPFADYQGEHIDWNLGNAVSYDMDASGKIIATNIMALIYQQTNINQPFAKLSFPVTQAMKPAFSGQLSRAVADGIVVSSTNGSLYAQDVPVNKLSEYLRTQVGGWDLFTMGQPYYATFYWATPPRPATDAVQEVAEFQFTDIRPCNNLDFDIAHFPCHISVQAYDQNRGRWNEVWDATIADARPRSTSRTEVHQMLLDTDWVVFRADFDPVYCRRIRIVLTRIHGAGPYLGGTSNPIPYPLGLRNCGISFIVTSSNQLPDKPVTVPEIGSIVTYQPEVEKAVNLLSGGQWRSDTQPLSYAVVNLYLDTRDAKGAAQVIDRFYIEPTYPGPHVTIYYSNDTPSGTFEADNNPLLPGVVNAVGIVTPESAGLQLGTATDTGYLDILNSALQFDPTVDWWIGIDVTPNFASTNPGFNFLFDLGAVQCFVCRGVLTVTAGTASWSIPVIFGVGEDLNVVVSYDATAQKITIDVVTQVANMLDEEDSSFEGGTIGNWNNNWDSATSVSQAQSLDGSHSYVLTDVGNPGGWCGVFWGNGLYMPCSPGQTLTFLMSLKVAPVPNDPATEWGWDQAIRFYDAASNDLGRDGYAAPTFTTEWSQAKLTVTVPEGATKFALWHERDDFNTWDPLGHYSATTGATNLDLTGEQYFIDQLGVYRGDVDVWGLDTATSHIIESFPVDITAAKPADIRIGVITPPNRFSVDQSTFENGVVADWVGHGGATVAPSTAQAHRGTHSMQVTAGPSGGWAETPQGVGDFPMSPGEIWTLSGWVYLSAAAARTVPFGFDYWKTDGSGNSDSASLGAEGQPTVPVGQWVPFTHDFTVNAGTAYGSPYIDTRAMVAGESIWLDDLDFTLKNPVSNFRLNDLILKSGVAASETDIDIWRADPPSYVYRPTYATDPTGTTDNAILRFDPSFFDASPLGLLGGPGNFYADLTWTPLPRDYTLQKGYMYIPPTSARFFNFEFTNLVAEQNESLLPIDREVKLFPTGVVDQTVVPTANNDPTQVGPGALTQQSLMGLAYADAVALLLSGTVNDVINPSGIPDTQALVVGDPEASQNAVANSWVFGFQPFQVGYTAPRWPATMVHDYQVATVRHAAKMGFYVGLNQLIAFRLNYEADDDTMVYEDHFDDAHNLDVSSEWIQNPNSLTTSSGAGAPALPATARSKIFNSHHNVRAVQFASQQTEPTQLINDDDFANPAKATYAWNNPDDWQKTGDALLTYQLSDTSVLIKRQVASIFKEGFYHIPGLMQPPMSPVFFTKVSTVEDQQAEASLFGGIVSPPQIVSAGGYVWAAARFTAISGIDESHPIHVQILSGISGEVLAEKTYVVNDAQTIEDFFAYRIGSGAPTTDTLQVRLIQMGKTDAQWTVDRLSLFDEGILWEFSIDGGATFYPAIAVRNNATGVMVLPTPGNRLVWRVTGYRSDLQINALQIRPWYDGLLAARPVANTHGPNLSFYDQTLPVDMDPEFRGWDRVIPAWWFKANQPLPGLVLGGVAETGAFTRSYSRPVEDTLPTPVEVVSRVASLGRTASDQILGPTNLFSYDGSTLEGSSGGWAPAGSDGSNTVFNWESDWAADGASSGELVAISPGNVEVGGETIAGLHPLTDYAFNIVVRAVSVARQYALIVEWHDSTGAVLRTDSSPLAWDSPTADAFTWFSVNSPASTDHAIVYLRVIGLGPSEAHRFDRVGFYWGKVATNWSPGGTPIAQTHGIRSLVLGRSASDILPTIIETTSAVVAHVPPASSMVTPEDHDVFRDGH